MKYLEPIMNTPIQTAEQTGNGRYRYSNMLFGDLVWKMHLHPDSVKYLMKNVKGTMAVVFKKKDGLLMYVARDDPNLNLRKYIQGQKTKR